MRTIYFKELYCIAYWHAMERFARSILAKDIMKVPVHCVTPDTPLLEVAEILSNRGISGLPVIDAAHKVLGVVSESDILSELGFKDENMSFMAIVTRCLHAGGCLSLPTQTLSAREIMSSPAISQLCISPRPFPHQAAQRLSLP